MSWISYAILLCSPAPEGVTNLQERLLSLWLKLMPFFPKQLSWVCVHENELALILIASCEAGGGQKPQGKQGLSWELLEMLPVLWGTGSNMSSALQPYFFPLISELPGQTHLSQGHCKTGQNSSASCDQMASQTLCTKQSLGSRDLNSVSPMPFLSLNHQATGTTTCSF